MVRHETGGVKSAVDRTARIGTSTDDVRRRNLSGVLTLVHRHRCMSRAELTRRTGLSRSTVKDLVEELVEHGLVEEALPTASTQVGRPSPVVRPQSRRLAIAVNPEIDSVTIGLVTMGGSVLEVTRRTTTGVPTVEQTVALAAETIAQMRRQLAPDRGVTAIGVAVPGLVHAAGSMVRLAPHLDWHDAQIGRMLGAATHLPVFAANAANGATTCAARCSSSRAANPVPVRTAHGSTTHSKTNTSLPTGNHHRAPHRNPATINHRSDEHVQEGTARRASVGWACVVLRPATIHRRA